MAVFLRIAAVFALLRAVGLSLFQPVVLGELANRPNMVALTTGLAIANLGFAYLFWRAGGNPTGERTAVYTALLVIGLRSISAVYEVVYLLEGDAAVLSLMDMIASVALFVGILNSLPATLRGAPPGE